MSRHHLLLALLASTLPLIKESNAAEIKRIPPPGITIPEDTRAELTKGAADLAKEIASLRTSLANKPKLLALLPDVQVFHKAVDWALRYNEFFNPKQLEAAKRQLAMGMERAAALKEGKAPWTEQTGLVIRAYQSAIDGSIQPYGLVVPEDYKAGETKGRRLDFFCHGRGETLSELDFIEQRLKGPGEFNPPGAITCHLYERFCNANHFAGESDLFEAWASLRDRYPIDNNRIIVRGFSMGGASTWGYAAHFAGLWAGISPGAGFAETQEFFHSFAQGKTPPPWYEQVLWRWYDATLYAPNLTNTTLVAYAGENDGQKQAGDIMERFLAKEGLKLERVWGAQVGHKYTPEAKVKIEEIMTAAAEKGRDPYPEEVRFRTYTLVYPNMKWVQVEGMGQEWEQADVVARRDGGKINAVTKNITAIRFTSPLPGAGAEAKITQVVLDGQSLPAQWEKGQVAFHREGEKWAAGAAMAPVNGGLRKTPGLCGPIDHAFMGPFIMVKPTGQPLNDAVGKWANGEMEHAIGFWRQVYRGDAPVKEDKAITLEDSKNANLVLWGDPSSNSVLAKIVAKLPIQWTKDGLVVGKTKYKADENVPVLIFPNPLNPQRYVVINSGVTFREKALLNNSDQTPKLPDWAVVDIRTPAGPEWPGLVMDAGFFNESWKLQ